MKKSRTKKIIAIIGATILAASIFATSASAATTDYRLNISTSVPQKSGPSTLKEPLAWQDNDFAHFNNKQYYYKYNDNAQKTTDINFQVKDKNYNSATGGWYYDREQGPTWDLDFPYLSGYGIIGDTYRVYGSLFGNLNVYNEITAVGKFTP